MLALLLVLLSADSLTARSFEPLRIIIPATQEYLNPDVYRYEVGWLRRTVRVDSVLISMSHGRTPLCVDVRPTLMANTMRLIDLPDTATVTESVVLKRYEYDRRGRLRHPPRRVENFNEAWLKRQALKNNPKLVLSDVP